MKRLEEMTEEELAALRHDDITKLVDLECAHRGIPAVPPEPAPPGMKPDGRDVMVYSLSGDLSFLDYDEAVEVAQLVNRTRTRVSLDYARGAKNYERVARPSMDLVTVSLTQSYSQESYERNRDAMLRWSASVENFENLQRDREEALGRVSDVYHEVWDMANAAAEAMRQREAMRSHWEHYKQLADGDERVAARFMRDAFPGSYQLVPEVLAHTSEVGPPINVDDVDEFMRG